MNERVSRLWCATEAKVAGYGGINLVSKATGVSRATIRKGIKELDRKESDVNRTIEHTPKLLVVINQ